MKKDEGKYMKKLKKEQLEHMVFPHNLAKDNLLVYQMYQLYNTAVELGGTIYEVAEASGFLSAFSYMESWMDAWSFKDALSPEHMTVVTECFVQWENSGETEQIFLFSSDAKDEEILHRKGKIKDGYFLIPEKALRELAEEGYFCLYKRRADGHNGKSFVRFNNAFGENRKMMKFSFRTENNEFVGDGWNRAILVNAPMEDVFVMPDLFAVKQAVRTYDAERLIRKTYDPRFSIERIDDCCEELLAEIEELIAQIFPEHWLTGYKRRRIDESYRKLIYQICYIRYFYEDIYRQVWSETYQPYGFSTACSIADANPGTLGIALGTEESYAVFVDANGTVRNIPAFTEGLAPENMRYWFRGTGDLRNAGIAYSELALTFRAMLQNSRVAADTDIHKVNVIFQGDVLSRSDITLAIRERKENAKLGQSQKVTRELMADMQLEGKNMDGLDIIRAAAELVNLPDFHVKTSVCAAAAKAYDAEEEYRLKEGEQALVFYLDATGFEAGFVEKRDGVLICLAHTEDADDWKKCIQEADERLPEKMKGVVCPTLEALGIHTEDERNKKVFESFHDDTGRVKRQFIRNDKAVILFDNGWLSFSNPLQRRDCQDCFSPVYQKCIEIVGKLQEEHSFDHFAKIYLAGNRCDDPGLWEYLEKQYHVEVCISGDLEHVVAVGAVMI